MGRNAARRAARKAARPAQEATAREQLAPRKPEVIHRRKYADGRETPMETHIKLAVNQTCNGCEKRPGETLILVYILVADLSDEAKAYLRAKHRGQIPIVQLKAGPAVPVSKTAACSHCRRAMLTAAAKGPSYAFVDIVDPPSEVLRAAVSVQVPRGEIVIARG